VPKSEIEVQNKQKKDEKKETICYASATHYARM